MRSETGHPLECLNILTGAEVETIKLNDPSLSESILWTMVSDAVAKGHGICLSSIQGFEENCRYNGIADGNTVVVIGAKKKGRKEGS